MAVNESIWGASSTWLSCLNNECKTSAKVARELLDDTLPLNELMDSTPCWCGVIQDKHDFYLAHSGLTTNSKFDPLEIEPLYNITEVVNVPFLLALGGSYFEYTFDFHNIWGRWAEIGSPSDGSMDWYITGQCKPIFNVHLNKLIFIPTLTAFADNDPSNTTSESFSLSDWINSGHTTHPYLSQLFITPYSNRGTDENPNWQPCYDSYDHYEYFIPNLETSDYIQNLPDSNFKIRYDFTNVASRKLTTLLMGCQHSYIGTYGTHRVIVDDDISHYVSDSDHVRYCRQYSQDLIDDIRTQIAFLGVFFLGDHISSLNDMTLTHPSVYCGIIDPDGYTHGDYSNGSDNEDRQQFTWEDSSESNYDPNATPPLPDNWGDNTPSAFALSSKLLANHWWKMTDADLYYALRHINEVDLENLDYNDTFGLNPIDGLLQLRRVYVNAGIAHNVLTPTSMSQIVIGELSVGIPEATALWYVAENKPLIYTCVEDYWVGEPRTNPNYQDFRAYSPFTSITFYDAFCGVIDVEPEKILNKYITITQTIDLLTGDKITSLYASPTTGSSQRQRVATLQGNCAEEIPINGQAVADYMRNKIMNTHNVISSSFGAIGHVAMGAAGASISAVSGNVIGAGAQALGTVANATSLATSLLTRSHEISHTIPSIVKISNGTNNVESLIAFPPMLIMYNPKMIESYNESEYGDKTGFAGYKIATLQSCGTGTHVVSHPRVNISGTSAEEYMLIDQLQKGIYVKEES